LFLKIGKVGEGFQVVDEFSLRKIVAFHVETVFLFVENSHFVLMLVVLDLLQKLLYLFVHQKTK
jgi:hypothetical protein